MMHAVIGEPAYPQLGPGSAGLHCATFGFLPAFRDLDSGETHLSTNDDGSLAPIHLIDALPEEWVIERDELGRSTALKETIIAGFVRDGRFYTYAEVHGRLLDA